MADDPSAISSEVFESYGVEVFKIPPGPITITQWNQYESHTVWRGGLRLIEQQVLDTTNDNNKDELNKLPLPVYPSDTIRLKLELFNVLIDENRHKSEVIWGVVYYNPIDDTKPNQFETIQRTESYKYFKLIIQIPGTRYSGSKVSSPVTQVALGLKFNDKIDAYTFIDRLQSYQKQFYSYMEQYNYEVEMMNLTKKQSELSLSESDDDFGDFVS